ncbi:MAG: hypothetical protein V1676_06320 [Candidatus Diapherotrites archaeon]
MATKRSGKAWRGNLPAHHNQKSGGVNELAQKISGMVIEKKRLECKINETHFLEKRLAILRLLALNFRIERTARRMHSLQNWEARNARTPHGESGF